MKVKYIGHASFQIITKSNTKILTDPWASNPIYGNTLCLFPQLRVSKKEYLNQNYIYISHDHPDHLCLKTLSLFDKEITILIRKYKSPLIIRNQIKLLGFKRIVELDDGHTFEKKNDFNFTLFADHTSTDSLCIVDDNYGCFLDQNDCLLSEEKYKIIGKKYKIDLGALFYSGGSMYPSSFDFTKQEKIKITKKRIIDQFNYSIKTAQLLNIKNVIPGANDMCLLKKSPMDEFTSALPYEFYSYVKKKNKLLNIILMQSGDVYDFEKKFKNNFYVKSKKQWLKNVDEYRNSLQVKELQQKIDEFENKNRSADIANFEKLMGQYLKLKPFSYTTTKKNKEFRVFFEVKCLRKKECFELYFSSNENKILKTTKIFSEKKFHMKISIDENLLQMCMNGEYNWEDMMNNKFKVVRKLNKYNTNEYSFWIFLSEFTNFLFSVKQQKLSAKKDKIKTYCWDINVAP